MSDSSNSDIEVLEEIRKKSSKNNLIPDSESTTVNDVDSPDDLDLNDAPSVHVSENENEEEEKKEEKIIKSIINHRVKLGKVQYLVKYKHSSKFPSDWVDEDDLIDYADLITKYMENDTLKPPKEEKVDLSNVKFDIVGAIKKKNKIYYQLHYENNETTMISAKKMQALDSTKLLKFLEKYCITEHKVDKC